VGLRISSHLTHVVDTQLMICVRPAGSTGPTGPVGATGSTGPSGPSDKSFHRTHVVQADIDFTPSGCSWSFRIAGQHFRLSGMLCANWCLELDLWESFGQFPDYLHDAREQPMQPSLSLRQLQLLWNRQRWQRKRGLLLWQCNQVRVQRSKLFLEV
jgi:hypothetical protein